MSERIFDAISISQKAIEDNAHRPWIIAFSGGKDSTATLKIFLSAFKKAKAKPTSVEIIYCDTGVENPVIDTYVKALLHLLAVEFADRSLPFKVKILKAPVEQRFFVKVIGRGYPTPTNSFRWCTKNLRINPVARFIQSKIEQDAIVVLGIRKQESEQRNRSVDKHGGEHWQTQTESKQKYDLFLPILNMNVSDVWDAVFVLDYPRSIDSRQIQKIYSDASGECPVIKSPNAPPCASGRFGCWTCTVVRKDHSAIKLIASGYDQLSPYLELRNWMSEFRNDRTMRWPERRNGVQLPSPFSVIARKRILEKVRSLEGEVKLSIVDKEETHLIEKLWEQDIGRELALKVRQVI